MRYHCFDRKPREGEARSPTPPLSRPGAAAAAAARPIMVVSTVAVAHVPSGVGRPASESASASVLTAMACAVGDAIVDPGATATVFGSDWLRGYLNALPSSLRATVVDKSAAVLFRFGDQRTTLSDRHWDIPIFLGGVVPRPGAHVIPDGLPLLGSRPALRVARSVLDLTDDTLWLKDLHVTVPLCVDGDGHLTVNLLPPPSRSALAVDTAPRRRWVSFYLPASHLGSPRWGCPL